MKNILCRLRCTLARFFYGRCGMDALGWALFVLQFALSLLSRLFPLGLMRRAVYFCSTVTLFAMLLRILSRDLPRRRAENERFLRLWAPRREALRGFRARMADRDHRYVKCSCGAYCRVPRRLGKIELKCPRCGKKKIVKT